MSKETWGAIDRLLWLAMMLVVFPWTVLSALGIMHMPALVLDYIGLLANRYCYHRWCDKVDREIVRRQIWDRIQQQKHMFENPKSVNYGVYSNVSPYSLTDKNRPFWKVRR